MDKPKKTRRWLKIESSFIPMIGILVVQMEGIISQCNTNAKDHPNHYANKKVLRGLACD